MGEEEESHLECARLEVKKKMAKEEKMLERGRNQGRGAWKLQKRKIR